MKKAEFEANRDSFLFQVGYALTLGAKGVLKGGKIAIGFNGTEFECYHVSDYADTRRYVLVMDATRDVFREISQATGMETSDEVVSNNELYPRLMKSLYLLALREKSYRDNVRALTFDFEIEPKQEAINS